MLAKGSCVFWFRKIKSSKVTRVNGGVGGGLSAGRDERWVAGGGV